MKSGAKTEMKTGVMEKRTQWNDILTTPCVKQ